MPVMHHDMRKYHDQFPRDAETVDWTDPDLARITRLRLISDPGLPFWDVSYCHGVLKNGDQCRVQLPFHQLPKDRRNAMILAHAKDDGVYANGLGVFDAINTHQ